MNVFLTLVYGVGFTPWERMRQLPAGKQALALLQREESGREPPIGRALDLGCGSGIWSVELAERGWDVTGVDVVPQAIRSARERAREADVEVRFVEGDISALESAGVGSDFRLVLDFGAVHGLDDSHRRAVGEHVSATTTSDATVLMYAMGPGRRGPLPRGMSRSDVEATYPGWAVFDEGSLDTAGTPLWFRRSHPRWYRLRRS